jgi:hypothetical protein
MYIMSNMEVGPGGRDRCVVASQGYWHPASILEPNLALALNNLARPRRSRRQIGSVTVTICEPTAVQCDHPLWS